MLRPIVELSLKITFGGVHSLHRQVAEEEATASRRMHGHTYQVEVGLKAVPDPKTGMVMDQSHLRALIEGAIQPLTGVNMDTVPNLGPATLENMACFIWDRLEHDVDSLTFVAVGRDSHGDRAVFRGHYATSKER